MALDLASLLQNSPNFVNPDYATPGQIAQARKFGEFLLNGAQEPVKSWQQGLANALSAGFGAYQQAHAGEQEREALRSGQEQTAQMLAMLLGGGQQGGASPAPATSAAAAPPASPSSNAAVAPMGAVPGMPASDVPPKMDATNPQGGIFGGLGYKPMGWDDSAPPASGGPQVASLSPTIPQAAAAASPVAAAPPAPAGPPATGAGAQFAQMTDPGQLAAILQNPWVPKETKDMVMGIVTPKVINDPYGRPMTYRMGDPTGAHLIPGVPGGVMKEGEFGNGVKLPVVVTPPTTPGGPPGMAVPGTSGGNAGGGPLGGAQSIIDQSNRNAAENKRLQTQGEEGAKAQMAPIAEAAKEAKTAPQALNAVNVIEDIAKTAGNNITTGPFADQVLKLKQAVNGLAGSDVMGSTAPAEIIKKMNAQLASAALPAFTNRGTQFDLKVFMENNPGLNNSVQGTLFLTNILKQIYRQNYQLSQLAADKSNWDNWGAVQSKFYADNPLVNPLTNNPLGMTKDTPQQTEGWKDMGNGVRIRLKP